MSCLNVLDFDLILNSIRTAVLGKYFGCSNLLDVCMEFKIQQ